MPRPSPRTADGRVKRNAMVSLLCSVLVIVVWVESSQVESEQLGIDSSPLNDERRHWRRTWRSDVKILDLNYRLPLLYYTSEI